MPRNFALETNGSLLQKLPFSPDTGLRKEMPEKPSHGQVARILLVHADPDQRGARTVEPQLTPFPDTTFVSANTIQLAEKPAIQNKCGPFSGFGATSTGSAQPMESRP
ncbi:hypothetical protein H7849_15105 [Alloacidobacterium dinghuense]|uniref:Uncharacterized protein n=1 Tax=Alloacidobacterium dinghuense TaxID=2763107 RepID=A0A7G8BD58_9BACT|nr:hypothetical protein [Alloacidobacterium dinghuense]QNI30478.1 hypothetical protein H7849_15105 [Alloacidobacterium dinghuense]